MKFSFAVAILATLLPNMVAAAPAKPVYSAVGQFSVVRNPNGAWSYLSNGSLLRYVNKACLANGLVCRWNGKPTCNSASILASRTGLPVTWLTIRLPADHYDMDPQAIANVATRWTAPKAGTYQIQGDFLGIDTTGNSHPVAIMLNGQKIYSKAIARFGQRDGFNMTRKLGRGAKVDFVVSTGRTCYYLGTGLKAIVKTL